MPSAADEVSAAPYVGKRSVADGQADNSRSQKQPLVQTGHSHFLRLEG